MEDLWINNVKDSQMSKAVKMAKNIAPRKATVMIYGESGVGKELMARYIHDNSQRKDSPFIAVNCAAVPENLLESELFGHEKGAFTGAHQQKLGKFELADKGTFLLDEISELPLQLQGKLLRVLQESEVERVGGTSVKKIDVRFICTSNKNLAEMVKKGEFRQDLFYRLNVIPLNIPA
ncbi:MAG: sigma-54 factor interaction domain-containing protein, partial [Bdellovibrionales bacterium]|nr:sigma-54 factor interaction domain-containing protein [Bdellovibrionales bacterium]